MIVKKNVLAVADIAARESTRYAISGARFRRVGGRCQADATDGRMLLRVEWSDEYDRQETPTPDSLDATDVTDAVDGFETILTVDHIKRIGKAIPKRASMKEQFKRAILPEGSANGRAPFHIADGSTIVDSETIDGSFPNTDDIIPALDTGAGLTHSAAGASVSIGVNPEYLERMCKAMRTAATDEESKGIRLTIPVDPRRPMLLTSRSASAGTEATGVIMPVNLDGKQRSYNDPPTYYETLRNCAALVKRIAGALADDRVKFEPVTLGDKTAIGAHAQCRELSDLCTEALEALEPTTDNGSTD